MRDLRRPADATIRKIGTSKRLPNTSTSEKRSNRRKSPVLAATMIKAAATMTPGDLGHAEIVERQRLMPMNSVTIVSALSRKRSMTLKAPQNLPNRSKMSRAWPTPVTAPSRSTIS